MKRHPLMGQLAPATKALTRRKRATPAGQGDLAAFWQACRSVWSWASAAWRATGR